MANILPGGDLISSQNKISPSTGLEGKQKTPALPTENIGQLRFNDSQTMPGGEPTNLDPTKYNFHLKVGADNPELRAQDQPIGQEIVYGAGRLVGTAATKLLEGGGFLYGMGEALLTDKSLAESFDNGWVNFWENAEQSVKDAMPIYHTNRYNQGNIFQQMGTLGFWMDDAIDGVAFLVSAYLESAGISMLGEATGAFTKLAKTFANTTKAVREGKIAAEALPKFANWVKKADLVTMSALNSGIEAGFEAKDTYNQLLKQGVSKEEAAKAARGTFLWNMGILMVPNYITNSMFFGKANTMSGRIKNITGPDGRLISEVAPITNAQRAVSFGKGMTESMVSEGAWEENIQLAVQDYWQKKAEGKEDRSQIDGIFSNWAKNWTTDEGQKSIALGMIIGMIPGGVSGVREAKEDRQNDVYLHTMLGHTIASVSKDLAKKDIYLKDDKGQVVIDEKTKEAVVDPFKLATVFVATYYTQANAKEMLAVANSNNQVMADRLEEERVSSLAYAYMNSEDGLEAFSTEMKNYARQKIESSKAKGEPIDEKEVNKLANQYIAKGQQYKTLFQNVQQAFAGLYNFQESKTGDKAKDTALYNLANTIKDQAVLKQFMASVDQMFWVDKAREIELDIAKTKATSVGETALGKDQVERLQKSLDAVNGMIKASEKQVKEVLNEKNWQKEYNDQKKKILEVADSNTETKPTETSTDNDFVTVRDKDGNEYTFQGKDKEGKLILVNKKTGKEETYTPEEATAKNIVLTGTVATPINEHLATLDKEMEERGTVTQPASTVHEEIKAREAEIQAQVDEEERNKARKESIVHELTNRNVTEVTGVETKEEVFKLATGEELAARYGDRTLAAMTLEEIFKSPLKEDELNVVYGNQHGTLFIDQETNEVVFKATDSGKEYIIGKTTDTELFSELKASDLGIIPLKHTIFDIRLDTDGTGIIVQGRRYVLDNDDLFSAIEEVDGEIHVTLKDVNGVSMTFTSQVLAAELAYTIELLHEAREVAYEAFLEEREKALQSDFAVVTDPSNGIEYNVYHMPDGSYKILYNTVDESVSNTKTNKNPLVYTSASQTTFVFPAKKRWNNGKSVTINFRQLPSKLKNGKPNPKYNKILRLYLNDLGSIIDKVAASYIEAGQRTTNDERTAIKNKIKDEIKEFIRNTRPATEEEIITAPGTSEIPVVKTESNEKAGQQTVAKTPGGTPLRQDGQPSTDTATQKTGNARNVEEVDPEPEKKKGRKKTNKDEEAIVDEKAEQLSKEPELSNDNTNKKDELGIETENLEDELDSAVERTKRERSHSSAHPATGVAYKAEDNTDLDKYLSNPTNNLKGFTLVATVDENYEGDDWKKGTVITREALAKTYRDRFNEEDYTALIDRVPIKLTLIDSNGNKMPFGGMYLHTSSFADEDTVVVTEEQYELFEVDPVKYEASRKKMIDEERKATREQRKAIMKDLMDGKKVVLSNLQKGAGLISQTKGTNRNILEVTNSADNGTMAISDGRNTLWDGKGPNPVAGRASSGNVIWATEETANGDTRNVKLNVAKVSEESARILLKAYQQLVNSKGGPNTLYEGDEVEGGLTVGEVIDYLVLDGQITNQSNKDTNVQYHGHLVSKTLYSDGGILYFGDKELNLRKKLTKEQENEFIDHITMNKNYIVPLKRENKYHKSGLGGKLAQTFKIGSITGSKGESYQSFLFRNGMVLTDLIKDPATGTIFSKPMFWFDPYGATKTVAPEEKKKKKTEKKPEKNEITEPEKKKAKAVANTDTGEIIQLKAKTLATLPAGSEIFIGLRGTQAVDDNDQPIGEVDDSKWTEVEVLAKTVVNGAGKVVFKVVTNKKKNREKLEEFDGAEIDVKGLATILKDKFNWPVYAELPKETTETKEELLGKLEELDTQELNEIDGVDPFAHAVVEGKPYEAGDLDKAIKNLRKKLGPGFTIKTEEDLIRVVTETGNVMAFGTFEKDAITLSKKLAKGTEYEEAFHRVSLLYLTPEQQQAIYAEARVKYKMKDATDRQVNERLAEDYREMETRGEKIEGAKGVFGKIKQFFTDLIDFIATVFTGKLRISNLDVNNLFRVMGKSSGMTGRLRWSTARKSSYEQLKRGDVYTHIVKGVQLERVKNTTQLTDIVNHLVFTMINHSGVIKTKDIGSLDYMVAREAMQKRVAWSTKKADEARASLKKVTARHYDDLAAFYQEIVDNYSIYLDLMKSQLEALGIRTILPENPEDETNMNGDNFRRYEKAAFELNGRDNAGAAIKLVIATLRATEELNSETLLNKFVDYDSMFDTLLTDLSEMGSVEDMIASLETKTTIPYKDLLAKLKADRETDPFDTLTTQFFHAMRKNRYKYRNALANKKAGKAGIEIADAETQKMGASQAAVWGQAFLLSEAFTNGMPNKTFLTSVIHDYTKLSNQVKVEYTNKKNNGTIPNYDSLFNSTIALFNKISIPIDKDTLNNILDKVDSSDRNKALYTFLVVKKTAPVFGNSGSFARLREQGKVTNNKGGEMLLDHIFKNESLFRDLIAPAYVEIHGGMKTNTILGPDGNPYYLLSENSYITDLFHAIRNNPDYGVNYNRLAKVGYNEHSYYLKQLADPDVRKKLEVVMFSYLSVTNARDRGRSYKDISDLEDTMVKIGLFESGLVVLPQLADRGHLYTMAGLKPLKFNYLYNDKTGELTLPQSVVDTFFYYAVDEYNQIQKVKKEIADAKKKGTEHLLKENYHFDASKGRTEEGYKNANGLKYQHFTGFNGKGYDLGTKDVKQLGIYKGYVRKVLEDRINDAMRDMHKQGIVLVSEQKGKIASVVNKMFDIDAIKRESKEFGGNQDITLRNKIANFQLNSIMATIEAEKMVFMSPAYYKNLDDKIKRYTAIASTGLVSRLNIPNSILPNDRLLHNNDNFTTAILATQKYDALSVREYLLPKFINIYMKNGYTAEAAEKRAEKALSNYTSVDPTDGQAYITPDMFRALSIRLGEWTEDKQEAFELSKLDRDLTLKEQQIVDDLFMQPLKFGYFGPEMGPNSASPLYYKMSLATLTPRLVKDTQLQHLYDRMTSESDPIDMVLFDSAVKVGVGPKIQYYVTDEDGVPNTDLVNISDVEDMPTGNASFQYLRRQTITEPHNELRDVVKTQFRKVSLSNIDDNRKYKVGNETLTGKELKEQNKEMMNELSDRGTDEFLNIIGVDKETMMSRDPEKLYDFIRTRARMSGMPDSLVDALAKQADGERFETDALPDRKWVQSAQISSLAKGSVDLKMPGTALIQMANFGLRKAEKDDSLQLIDKDGYMEAKVSIEVFRNAIPDYAKKTYAERLEYANAMFVGIGYRVPTQGLVSTVPLKIVGFLPETSTATVVLPSEFTTLTGSDFDIDKLYFIRHNYKIVGGKPVRVQFMTEENSSVDKRIEAYSHEAIADKARQMKKAWYAPLQQMYGKRKELKAILSKLRDDTESMMVDESDIDTKSPEYIKMVNMQSKAIASMVGNLSDEIAKMSKKLDEAIEEERLNWISDNAIDFLDWSIMKQNTKAAIENRLIDSYFSVLTANDHIIDNYMPLDAATGLLKDLASKVSELEGHSRNYPSLHTASYIYQGEVKHKYLWGKKGIGPFARANVHHILGQIAGIHLGTYIGVGNTMETEDGMVTDLSGKVGKDRESILDWLSALINAHVDIAKDAYIFSLNVNDATYSVGELLVRAGAGEQAFLFLAQPILKEYALAKNNYKGKLRAIDQKPLNYITSKYKKLLWNATVAEKLKKKVKSDDEIFDNDRLKKDINENTNQDAAFYARQLQILEKFAELNDIGKYLFQAVEATTVDTKRFGNNISELRRFTKLVNKVLKDNVIKNMDKLFDMTFIGNYYKNSVQLGQSIFKDTTVMASDCVTALSDRIMEEIGEADNVTQEGLYILNSINDDIFSGIVGRFMVNNMGVKPDTLSSMLYGDNTMVARLNKIKNNKLYSDNPFIKLLQPSMSFRPGIPDIIITFTATDVKTKWAKDRIIDGWAELIASDNKDVSDFAKDLVTYSFFTSGFSRSIYSIYNYVPPVYLKEIGFSKYMKNMRVQFNDVNNYALLESVHDDIFQNAWDDDDMVPRVSHTDVGESRKPNGERWGEKYPMQISIRFKTTIENLHIGYNTFGERVFKPFVKLVGESGQKPILYKYMGYITKDGVVEPVYVISKKKGYWEAGKKVVEFGQERSVIEGNDTKDLPGDFDPDSIGTEKGTDRVVYDFRSFQPMSMLNSQVAVPIGEDDIFDTSDLLEPGELLEDYSQTTGETVGTKVDGLTQQKIDETNDNYKHCNI